MFDRDFVSHFVVFYLKGYKSYKPDMDTFLNEGMEEIDKISENQRQEMIANFDNAMKTIASLMGEDAFRKKVKGGKRARGIINKALFEIWSVCLAKRTVAECKVLIKNKNKVEQAFSELFTKSDEFTVVISLATGDRTRTLKRFEIMENLIQNNLHENH